MKFKKKQKNNKDISKKNHHLNLSYENISQILQFYLRDAQHIPVLGKNVREYYLSMWKALSIHTEPALNVMKQN